MAKKNDNKANLDRRLAKSVGHPIRIEALRILNERTASPSELAKALGEGVSHVSYHIQELSKYGCVELVKTEPRRGAVEHFYRVARPNGKAKMYVDDEEARALPRWERAEICAANIQSAFGEALGALRSGSLESRADSHTSWVPMELDQEGWSEVTALLSETLNEVMAIASRSAERLESDSQEPIATVVSMLAFERSESPVLESSSRNAASGASSNGNGSQPH